jgi:hypothetical protein
LSRKKTQKPKKKILFLSPQVGRQPLPLVREVLGLAGDGAVERLEPGAVLLLWEKFGGRERREVSFFSFLRIESEKR